MAFGNAVPENIFGEENWVAYDPQGFAEFSAETKSSLKDKVEGYTGSRNPQGWTFEKVNSEGNSNDMASGGNGFLGGVL